MLDVYRAVFRTRGTAAFCAAAWVMRLPIAIYPIGLVLILSARTGQYGFAGVLSGVYVVANGVGNPVLARVSDRIGQQRILLPATVLHAAATVALALLLTAGAPNWTLLPPTAACGFLFLSVSSLVRARWSYVLAGRPELGTAYSLESTLDEIVFVTGPLIATVIATRVTPVLVLYIATALVVGGAVWLYSRRDSAPPPRPHGQPAHRSAVLERGMPLLIVVAAAMGVVLAGAEVSIVAFCGQHGERGLSGAVLAAFAGGSAVAGFLYGTRTWQRPLLDRFRVQAVIFGLLPPLFLAAGSIAVLALCTFVVGFGIAPTLTTAFGLIEQLVPGASLTEGLAWLVTGLSLGYGGGAAITGHVTDAYGARIAFGVSVGAGVLTALLAVLLHARLRARTPAPAAGSVPA